MEQREKQYETLYRQIAALVESQRDETAVLANVSAALHASDSRFFWTGFYLVRGQELLLGPFQGAPACYRIAKGRGVCGTAWEKKQTQLVPHVEEFQGHIACSPLTRSEIVVPMADERGEVRAVMDIDSTTPEAFDQTDARWLQRIAQLVCRQIY